MRTRTVLLVVATVAVAATSDAAVTVYGSRSDWDAAIGGAPTFCEDFSGLSADGSSWATPLDCYDFTLRQVGPGRPQSPGGPSILADSTSSPCTRAAFLWTDHGADSAVMQFSQPLRAWGADISALAEHEGLGLVLFLVDGGTETISVPTTSGFFGFTTTRGTSLTKLQFCSERDEAGGNAIYVDNVAGSATPELSSGALLLLGALPLGLGWWRRRTKV